MPSRWPAFDERLRARLVARVSRLWRWEFWPSWLFYLPLLPWIAYLAVRHRGLMTPTAANPGIPHGGIVGESKYQILSRLPPDAIIPTALISPGPADERAARLADAIQQQGWSFPLILKPDVGERGAGLRSVNSLDEATAVIARFGGALLAQVYHPGPFEAGIFYYRMPPDGPGRIFSITDKVMPVVDGDGASTVEALIWRHPRLRMQARTFLSRLGDRATRVLPRGERLTLAVAGNHCQGTLFRDGSHLVTPALEAAIDRIARHFDGFYFGRFDVRYSDVDAFKAGRDLSIIELNGVTSESTNIYDPTWSIFRAYGVLARQWQLLFEIGERNRRAGHPATRVGTLWRELTTYYRGPRPDALAD